MPNTPQQQNVIDTALKGNPLIICKAIAGSGKTYTLVELSKSLNPANGMYLAYNKAIAEEAITKFKGTSIKCSTIHSLAYKETVWKYGLRVGFFNPRDIKKDLKYNTKKYIVDMLEEFCLSSYIDPHDFMEEKNVKHTTQSMIMEYLNKMTSGEIPCTHSFYLKLYHVYLSTGEIEPPKVDLLLADEFGDITALTLEIFNLIKAKTKVAVGDPYQNVYSFNNTINGFEALKGLGIEANLTNSFRVSAPIAKRIEGFIQQNLDSEFEFTGRDYASYKVTSEAFISRYNSGLVEHMFTLMRSNTPFHTTRKVSTIIELPLALANAVDGMPIKEFKYKFIETLRKKWEGSYIIKRRYPKLLDYLAAMSKEDKEVTTALNVVRKHGYNNLMSLNNYAEECRKADCNLTLTTAHSSKGLEFSSVTISKDLNESTKDAISKLHVTKAGRQVLEEELRLYYVACSRAMVELNGADCLPRERIS